MRRTASVGLSPTWWGRSAADLQAEILRALEEVGGRRAGDAFTVRLDVTAQRRLRCEAQLIRNRAVLARNGQAVVQTDAQVRDVRAWVLRTRSDIRHSRAVAHLAA
jgi:hypothetical protein